MIFYSIHLLTFICLYYFVKTYNEVQHCFLVIGSVYSEDLLIFLLSVGFGIYSYIFPNSTQVINCYIYKHKQYIYFTFYQKFQSKDELSIVGALCVLKHLLPRYFLFFKVHFILWFLSFVLMVNTGKWISDS